jgi:2-oxoglutarate dehydrogenase complex dehydrogenase (E1) component-like enzyme
MLIRAYRIRGHLIANLDPLSIQKKKRTFWTKTRKLWI